ncbi:hypothetical protein AVEN_194760-1 [Araneus ventricosus]|uniref:Uncharacterized protein n=1 Tax=Araneus ventricosus TaxID=182803 RepID=A0A4Y2B3B7_ARAVE|nr:hypothetical protein AVEN_194760-1 [Araneus ventricosus]
MDLKQDGVASAIRPHNACSKETLTLCRDKETSNKHRRSLKEDRDRVEETYFRHCLCSYDRWRDIGWPRHPHSAKQTNHKRHQKMCIKTKLITEERETEQIRENLRMQVKALHAGDRRATSNPHLHDTTKEARFSTHLHS